MLPSVDQGLRCINLGSLMRGGSVRGAVLLSLFKRRRFPVEIILLCVRWYCKYGISYRDLAEMMSRARRRGRPIHHLSLGPALCAGDREAGSPIPGTSVWLMARR